MDTVPDKNAYCNVRCRNGKTALFTADASCCKLILESVTDPEEYCNIVDNFGNTALHFNKSLDKLLGMFEFIKDKRRICYTKNRNGQTFLHCVFKDTLVANRYSSERLRQLKTQKVKNIISAILEHIDDIDDYLNLSDNRGLTLRTYTSHLANSIKQ